MSIVSAVLLVILLAALIRLPLPPMSLWLQVFIYLAIILVCLIALLTKWL